MDAADTTAQTAEGGVHAARSAYRRNKLRPYRAAVRAEHKADHANVSALNKEFQQQNGGFSSNPYSRWQQRRAVRKEYEKAKKAGERTVSAAQTSARAARKAEKESKKAAEFVARHKKGFLIVGALAVIVAIFFSMFSSCSVLLGGLSGVSGAVAATYPSADEAIMGAEARYCQMEADLQSYLNTYESTHSYDEYNYDLDAIGHDPYVLTSLVTAYLGGEWTMEQAESVLQMLFNRQYTLTENVTPESRTRTFIDGAGEEVTEEYTCYVCTVTLNNAELSHLPVEVLSESQLSVYAAYMSGLGNRADLFPDSEYIGRYTGDATPAYTVPPDALEDEQFAAMLTEAEKYLGYPYVWGGSSPSTSFDCSGFVSWVLNHCGAGWNVGRLGAMGLCDICTLVRDPRPGDLVFFWHTYDAPYPDKPTHVGIYVGDGWMLHCGDPIQYTNLNTSYWQEHFYAYGRLPEP